MSIMKTDSLREPRISVKSANSDALDPTQLPTKAQLSQKAKATEANDGAELTKAKKLPVNADTVERQAQHTKHKAPVQQTPIQVTPEQRLELKRRQFAWLNKEGQVGLIAGRPDKRRVEPELGPVAGPPHLRRSGPMNQQGTLEAHGGLSGGVYSALSGLYGHYVDDAIDVLRRRPSQARDGEAGRPITSDEVLAVVRELKKR